MRLKKYAAMILATMMCMNTVTVNAASLDDTKVTGCPEDLYKTINEQTNFQAIPDEVMKLFSKKGGRITFKDRLSHNGKEVSGLYHDGGTKDCQIEMSLNWANQGFPNMTAYDLTHEIGHFVYFNSTLSDEDRSTLDSLYQRYSGFAPNVTCVEEAFAGQYAVWKSGGYGMLDEEKAMFEQVENRLVENYNAPICSESQNLS